MTDRDINNAICHASANKMNVYIHNIIILTLNKHLLYTARL